MARSQAMCWFFAKGSQSARRFSYLSGLLLLMFELEVIGGHIYV